MLKAVLAHPLTRGLDINDPKTTNLRRRIVQEKGFLRKIYDEWYRSIAASIPDGSEPVLELGSGAGFLREYVSPLVTSEVFKCEGIDVVLDGTRLPLRPASLRAIVMTDVLHHIPDIRSFFVAATNCVKPGGAMVMVEPWLTSWSKIIYSNLHHEPFEPSAQSWEFPKSGPLSAANGALPWIVFQRDRIRFEREFPDWKLSKLVPTMPFSYLVSGGVSMRSLAPAWSYSWCRAVEKLLPQDVCAMFALIVLTRHE